MKSFLIHRLLQILLLASLFLGVSLSAQEASHVKASLLSSVDAIEAGTPFDVALQLEMEPHWHTYFREPGDSGFATSIEWELPEGFSAGPIHWPRPWKISQDLGNGEALISYGYEDEVLLVVTITPPAGELQDAIKLAAEVNWLECKDICLPGEDRVSLTLAGDGANAGKPSAHADKIAQSKAEAVPEGQFNLLGTIELPGGKRIPATAPSKPVVQQAKGEEEASFLEYLLKAFLGGLILNLMPCVFPVIGLKIMGFTRQAGEDKAKVRVHGLLYAFGVLVSLWLLVGVYLGLRTAGEAAGWGFQLQQPWMVFVLALLFLALAMNLSGVFEIGLSAVKLASVDKSESPVGTFFSGMLAVIVATPCTGPFMGTALGATLTMSEFETVLIFTGLGLGLALPYLLLSFKPTLLAKMPRPGPWMETFKQALAFPLYATVGYLVWVQSGQVVEERLLNVFFALSIFAMALWLYGRFASPSRPPKTRRTAILLTLALIALAGWLSQQEPPGKWEDWSASKEQALREDGRTVFVDFTAKWCVTCQFNKRTVFNTEEAQQAFQKHKVALLKADWTNWNPAITEALAKLGRNAVPTNVIYKPGQDPILLPEALTIGILLDALEGDQ